MAKTTSDDTTLTFSPRCICGNQFIDECHIFKPFPLRLTDDFWIAAFVCPKQVQIEHHDSTLPVSGRVSEKRWGSLNMVASYRCLSNEAEIATLLFCHGLKSIFRVTDVPFE